MKVANPQKLIGKYAVRRTKGDAIEGRDTTYPGEKALGSQRKERVELKKLKRITQEAHYVLATAESIFPLQLFPDKITIDRHKLSIVYKQFFNMQQTISVPIENIKNIEVECGPLFGSLTVTSDNFVNNTQQVTHLKKSDAYKIQRLIQGAMIAKAEGIDISRITSTELIDLLENLGKGDSPDKDYSEVKKRD